MTLSAAVFSFRACCTSTLGFLIKEPSVEFSHDWLYEVVHLVETGEVYLIISFSKVGAPTVFDSSLRNTNERLRFVIRTLAKPKARSISLPLLIRSTIASQRVLSASLTTSAPRQAPAATGTGLAKMHLNPCWKIECCDLEGEICSLPLKRTR